MKRKKISILVFIMLVTTGFLIITPSVSANSVTSSKLYFEGTLTDNGDGTYSGILPMIDEAATGIGDSISGYDLYANNGDTAWFGNDPGTGPVWTSQVISDHDAWPTWNPDTPDWYQYSLNLYKEGTIYKWAVRNHAGATALDPWYNDPITYPARGVPMSGDMSWYDMYALETDTGAYLPGTGTSEIPGGAAGKGGGAGTWDMDWSWGSEVVPLQRPGFNVQIIDLGGDQYRVILTPANPPPYHRSQKRLDDTQADPITTDVTVVGGGGTYTDDDDDSGGQEPDPNAIEPFIKHKWELVQEIDYGGELIHQIDEDPDHDFLSVSLFSEGNRIIHYYLIVEEKTYNLARAYADVWHPDGKFKYQIELTKLDTQPGIDAWNHVTANYPEVITRNIGETDAETLEELQQEEAFVYHGWAELSYCQPAGWYTICARAVDSHGMWSTSVWNWFWYQPTASIALDFTSISYGTIGEGQWKWTGGDTIFSQDDGKPTIRNTGNVPLRLRFQQDDMNFGKTLVDGILEWNVRFDARLGNAVDGDEVTYWPDVLSGWVDELEMCTEEKLDFSIHIYKGVPGQTYNGELYIYAQTYKGIYGNGPYQVSPNAPDVGQLWYNGVAPDGVPDPSTSPGFQPI